MLLSGCKTFDYNSFAKGFERGLRNDPYQDRIDDEREYQRKSLEYQRRQAEAAEKQARWQRGML
jgi:hypothetical protein